MLFQPGFGQEQVILAKLQRTFCHQPLGVLPGGAESADQQEEEDRNQG